jgi:hypothetical protein
VLVVMMTTVAMMGTMIVTAVVTIIAIHLHLSCHHRHHYQSSEILQTVANKCWLLVLNQPIC